MIREIDDGFEARESRSPFTEFLADVLVRRRDELTREWLDRLALRIEESPRRIFPTRELLNHIPEILARLARSIGGSTSMETELVKRDLAMLTNLRRDQGYGLDEVLLEFDLLREILFEAIVEETQLYPEAVAPHEAVRATLDVQRALHGMSELTTRIYHESEEVDRVGRMTILSSFARTLSHELRGRLNVARLTIDAYRRAEGARREALLSRLDDLLDRIEEDADDALVLAAAQSRESRVAGRRQGLTELIEEVLRDTEELARSRNVTLRRSGTPPEVHVDASRVQLVLLNLVTNSIKFSDPSKSERWVEISVRPGDRAGEHRIDVSDNGVGIPETLRERVFEDSFEENPAKDGDEHGIGLTLARAAIEQLGGHLWLERSEPGLGSTFSFTLGEPRSGSVEGGGDASPTARRRR